MDQFIIKYLKVGQLAVRSLLRHKLRAFLSLLGVIFGVAAVLAMLSVGEGARQETLNQIEQLGTKNIYIKAVPLTEGQEKKAREKLSRGLNYRDAERLLTGCKDILDIACLKEIKAPIIGMIKDIIPQIIECSSNYNLVLNISVSEGRFITDQDVSNKNQVCVLGENVAKRLGMDGKPGSFVRIENNLFRVVGVLKGYDRNAAKASPVAARNYNDIIFIPTGTEGIISRNHRPSTTNEVNELIIRMKTPDAVIKSIDIIKRIMELSHGGTEDYQIVVPQELLRQSQKTQRTFNVVLGSIAFISLLVGGIGIMNIMLATVSERTKEIGVRRAIGATQEDIIFQFIAEAVILTFSGGLVGIFAGMAGVWIISTMAGWKTAITIQSIALPLIMSLLTGIFFGLYPAYTAAKMDPIAALRNE